MNFTTRLSKPRIMGIINVTPDSFSDGGRFPTSSAAAEMALRFAEEGADMIDIGGESSRPGALPVPLDEELRRTIPVIEEIRRHSAIPLSIDTTKAQVARQALAAGVDLINDISAGLFDEEMLPLAASLQKPVCLMHMKGKPKTMQDAPSYNDLIAEITAFLREAIQRAVAAGIKREHIIIDPGIGFGKRPQDNVVILKRLKEFLLLEVPILIGTSKKSFIGNILGYDINNRLEASLSTLAVAVDAGVSIFRVHDVAASRRFLDSYLLCRTDSRIF